jgi:hypothetical protein
MQITRKILVAFVLFFGGVTLAFKSLGAQTICRLSEIPQDTAQFQKNPLYPKLEPCDGVRFIELGVINLLATMIPELMASENLLSASLKILSSSVPKEHKALATALIVYAVTPNKEASLHALLGTDAMRDAALDSLINKETSVEYGLDSTASTIEQGASTWLRGTGCNIGYVRREGKIVNFGLLTDK